MIVVATRRVAKNMMREVVNAAFHVWSTVRNKIFVEKVSIGSIYKCEAAGSILRR